jgi:hypothetical protein
MRRFLVGLTAVGAAVCLAACGGPGQGGGDTQTVPARLRDSASTKSPERSCEHATKVLVDVLKSSLTMAAGDLRHVSMVPMGSSDAPVPGWRHGIYVVAGQFTGRSADGAIGVWVVSSDMARTGGGFGSGADSVTRKFSELGADGSETSPVGAYATTVADSVAGRLARHCAEAAS